MSDLSKITVEDIENKFRWKLDPWQREVVESNDPYLIMCCGRKCGKTHALAIKITLDVLTKDFAQTDGICIISKGQRQARELFLTVRGILAGLGIQFGKDLDKDENYSSMTMMKLWNGNKIYSLPCGWDGVTIRTYSFYKMYRDEDAFIPDAVDAAVNACLAVHGVQEIRASTPCGTTGSFYKAWHGIEWTRWHRMSKYCARILPAFLKREKGRMTKTEYEQEYEARFIDVADGIISGQMVATCSRNDVEWDKTLPLYLGVDFARFGDDENVIAYNYFKDGIAHVKIEVIHSKYRTTHIVGRLRHVVSQHPNFKLVVTDEGGMGGGATDMLIEALGRRKVIGVQNQSRQPEADGRRSKFMKTHLYRNLIKMMEQGKIVFDDDIAIVRSLRSMKYRYTMQGDLSIFGRDSHAAEAIVRAVFPMLIGKKPIGDITFKSVPHETYKAYQDDNVPRTIVM